MVSRGRDRTAGHGLVSLRMDKKRAKEISQMEKNEFDVTAYLHRDAKLPVTTGEISAQSGLPGRTVREAIRRAIIDDGVPIVHDNASGSWIAENDDQKMRCVKNLRHRAKEISRRADALEVCEVYGAKE